MVIIIIFEKSKLTGIWIKWQSLSCSRIDCVPWNDPKAIIRKRAGKPDHLLSRLNGATTRCRAGRKTGLDRSPFELTYTHTPGSTRSSSHWLSFVSRGTSSARSRERAQQVARVQSRKPFGWRYGIFFFLFPFKPKAKKVQRTRYRNRVQPVCIVLVK